MSFQVRENIFHEAHKLLLFKNSAVDLFIHSFILPSFSLVLHLVLVFHFVHHHWCSSLLPETLPTTLLHFISLKHSFHTLQQVDSKFFGRNILDTQKFNCCMHFNWEPCA